MLGVCYDLIGLHLLRRDIGLLSFLFPIPPIHRSPCTIRYNLVPKLVSSLYNMIWQLACIVLMYNINLGATTTTTLSIRGVTIPIDLVSSAMDSIRWRVVLFKSVTIPTSDPKSEFSCQSSLSCAEPTDPLNTSYTWDISHTLVTTYHPYCQSPSALTKYLKQKLRHQQAKCLGRSLSAQVEQNIPLKRNIAKTQGVSWCLEGVDGARLVWSIEKCSPAGVFAKMDGIQAWA